MLHNDCLVRQEHKKMFCVITCSLQETTSVCVRDICKLVDIVIHKCVYIWLSHKGLPTVF